MQWSALQQIVTTRYKPNYIKLYYESCAFNKAAQCYAMFRSKLTARSHCSTSLFNRARHTADGFGRQHWLLVQPLCSIHHLQQPINGGGGRQQQQQKCKPSMLLNIKVTAGSMARRTSSAACSRDTQHNIFCVGGMPTRVDPRSACATLSLQAKNIPHSKRYAALKYSP